ncbi:maleylpyruvate isomerase N-terminal domain-containing protein [Nakamurella sp. A5-74]|uniref:Maleylpyruvate isomerase N-terminal domain-containing protein n=1 Tax=Nakamurella sp. A5-74 TaxID=3158264 RepID=A0AAU8DUZ2_9ACTN
MTSTTRSGAAPTAELSPTGAAGPFTALLHAAQWGAIRAWVDAVPPSILARPSTLRGWSIDELLSHLATSVETIGDLRPADERDTEPPLSVLAYLTGYQQRSALIRQRSTRKAAARTDRGGELDEAWATAGRTLISLGPDDSPVRAPGGIIRLSDFLLTRLIELVVHGLDLRLSVRALENAGPVVEPLVLPLALRRVAAALRALCARKAGARGGFEDVFDVGSGSDDLHDVRLVLLATGRDADRAEVSSTLRAVLPLF